MDERPGRSSVGLECLTGGQEVAGSNPVAPMWKRAEKRRNDNKLRLSRSFLLWKLLEQKRSKKNASMWEICGKRVTLFWAVWLWRRRLALAASPSVSGDQQL